LANPVLKEPVLPLATSYRGLLLTCPHAEILEDYPSIKEEHVKAALLFAANREAMVKIVAG